MLATMASVVPASGQDLLGGNGDFENGTLSGWTVTEGGGWDVVSFIHPDKEGVYYASTCDDVWPSDGGCRNSSGEADTGVLISDVFTVDAHYLQFRIAGFSGPDCGRGHNEISLRRASDHHALFSAFVPCQNAFQTHAWDVSQLTGQPVYLRAQDDDAAISWAWIAIDDVHLTDDAPDTSSVTTEPPVRKLSSGALGEYNEGPAWSPDGQRIAFLSRGGSGFSDLYLVRTDGTDLQRLTMDGDWDGMPIWSPDGLRLAFSSRKGIRSDDARIHLIDASGDSRRHLTADLDRGSHQSPAWSPDGEQIAFVSHESSSRSHIWIVEIASGVLTQKTSGDFLDRQPFWSPDGQLGFQSNRDSDERHDDIYVFEEDGSLSNLTRHPARDGFWFYSSAGRSPWSPDGRWIAFSSDRDSQTDAGDIYLYETGSGAIRRMTASRKTEFAATWSPDSQRLAYEYSNQGNEDLFVVDITTGVTVRITDEQTGDSQPVWSPDGKWIAYTAVLGTRMDIMVVSSSRQLELIASSEETTTIDEDVLIGSSTQLEELLERVGDHRFKVFGDLTLSNTDLTDLTALKGLIGVEGGMLRIQGNELLKSLKGLEQLRQLDELAIRGNPQLESLQGLGGLVEVTHRAIIEGNRGLLSLEGLHNLRLAGQLIVSGNFSLPNLEGLGRLHTVGGWPTYAYDDLIIARNQSLQNLAGLDSLSRVDGTLDITGNPNLTSLSGLENLNYIQLSLKIDANPMLQNLDGLASLDTLTGVPWLGYQGGRVDISRNTSLKNLRGLDGLRGIRLPLRLSRNDSLTSLAGVRGFDYGNLEISECHSLTDLADLLGRRHANNVVLKENASLQTLAGLDSIQEVGSLNLSENPSLTSLTGLEQLGRVRENLTIFSNDRLERLPLTSLTRVEGNLWVHNNPALAVGEAEALQARLNGQTADEDSTAADEPVFTRTILYPAYPNPFNAVVQVTYDLAEGSRQHEPVRLSIYSMTGQLVRTLVWSMQASGRYHVEWDGTDATGRDAAAGVYLVRFETQDIRKTTKVLLIR